MSQLSGLVCAGNTVVAVEHNMRMAAASDWIIDISAGAGNEGGPVGALCEVPHNPWQQPFPNSGLDADF